MAYDEEMFLKNAARSENYTNYLTKVAREKTFVPSPKILTYDDYITNKTEKNRNWDAFVLDDSKRPQKQVERQKLYLKKIPRKSSMNDQHYNVWQYLDDITSGYITYDMYPDGFISDEEKAQQVMRLSISSKKKLDYHITKKQTEKAVDIIFESIKPTLFNAYNKFIVYAIVILSVLGFDFDLVHLKDRYLLKYEKDVRDGFVDD